MLLTLLFLAATSLGLSLLLTPIIRTLALRCNLVDLPDNKRKVHKKPVPRVGGIALAAAYFGSLLLVATFLAHRQPTVNGGFATVKLIAPAAMLIFLIGLADDIFNLKPWHKFGVQIVAAGMVVSAGVHIHSVAALSVHPVLGALVSILWLVACTNAVNLIDGLDGLAAGISFLATLTVLIASVMSGNMGLTIAAAPLAAALLGFLVFNFNPASIFLGDCGSLLLGFLLGCYGILWSRSSATLLEMTAPLMAVAVPLIDTTLAIARRSLSGQPIFKADRSHIHHRLLARGLSHRSTVLLLYVAAGIAGSLSLCLIWARDQWEAVVFAAFSCAVILGVRQLDYAEFHSLPKILLFGGLPRATTGHPTPQTFEEGMEATQTADLQEKTAVYSPAPFETQQRPAA
jgi:UDP-GlcNAc:undecaprenyl-phosphate GlcNAc-1-phosphate transferase